MSAADLLNQISPSTYDTALSGGSSAQIQQAIASGKTVFYFPRGTNELTAPIVLPAGYFTFYGDSRAMSVMQSAGDIIQIDGATNLELHDIRLRCTGDGKCISTTANGQLIDSVLNRVWLDGVERGATGIDCLFSTTTIEACMFESLAVAVNVQNEPSYVNISDVMIVDCAAGITGGGETVKQTNVQVIG